MPFLPFLRTNAAFLTAGALLTFSSSWGQTYFISLFAGHIMASFALTDAGWGLVYSVATTTSAVVMVWLGTVTDHYRARRIALIVMPLLALASVGMAVNTVLPLLVFLIFALRLLGQGMMSQIAIVSMARWFVASRGRALAITSMGFAFGNAVLPVVFVALMLIVPWQWLWVLAAGLIVLCIPLVQRLLSQERTPQSVAQDTQAPGMGGRHWTRVEMLRHPLFWLALPMLLGPPAWGTALFFQQVHFAGVKGFSLTAYTALFPLYILAVIAATFLAGAAVDRFGAGRVVSVYLWPWALGFAVLAWAPSLGWAAVGLVICGLGAGVQATAPTAFWAEYYGTRNIGSIKAAATAIMVLGSAIGPGITGVLITAGVGIEQQFAWIGVYFIVAALSIMAGVRLVASSLPPTPQVDV
ncbi:MAG: MFS transporter [Shimia sp.]